MFTGRLVAVVGLLLVPVAAAGQNGRGANALPNPPAPPVSRVPPIHPALVKKVEPVYSEKARRAGIQGEVWLDVSVRANGSVGNVSVEKSLDTVYGLDQRAIAAVKQWTYQPRPPGDNRVYPPTRVVIPFHLTGVVPSPAPEAPGVFGEGAYRVGQPRLVLPREKTFVEPAYTTRALRAKITGSVTIEAVVLADGTVGQARVVKSLDQNTGLDDQALGAAREWTFSPATLDGRAVPVIVRLELVFRLH
jgi:protein TonB